MTREYKFSLGQLIYTVRKINKLTQVDFSKQIGVVQSTISKIEKDVFEDVPFSLVARVADDFKVPLAHFSTGNLPIRLNSGIKRAIPREYLEHGVFRAKTVFIALTELESKLGPKIYRDLKLLYPYLCLSNIYYSFEFINKLYSLTKDDLLKCLDNIQVVGLEDLDEKNLEKYFSSLYGIELVEKPIFNEQGYTVSLTFQSTIHELDKIYLRFLELELKSIFKTTVKSKNELENNIYKLELEVLNV